MTAWLSFWHAKILTLVHAGKIDLAISPFILDEVEGVLVKKFGWTRDRAQEVKQLMRSMAIVVVDPKERISVIKGNDADNRILECVIEAKGNFLPGQLRQLAGLIDK